MATERNSLMRQSVNFRVNKRDVAISVELTADSTFSPTIWLTRSIALPIVPGMLQILRYHCPNNSNRSDGMLENVAVVPVDCMLLLHFCFYIRLDLERILALTKCSQPFLLLRDTNYNCRLPFALNWLERSELLSLLPRRCHRCCWRHLRNDLSVEVRR